MENSVEGLNAEKTLCPIDPKKILIKSFDCISPEDVVVGKKRQIFIIPLLTIGVNWPMLKHMPIHGGLDNAI